eukprot:9348_1
MLVGLFTMFGMGLLMSGNFVTLDLDRMHHVPSAEHFAMSNHRESFSPLDSKDIEMVTVSDSILQLPGYVHNDTKAFKWSNMIFDGVLAKLYANDSARATAWANRTEQSVCEIHPGMHFGVLERPRKCTNSLCDCELRVQTNKALAFLLLLEEYHFLQLETPRRVSEREMLFSLDIPKNNFPVVIYIHAKSRLKFLSFQMFNANDPFHIVLSRHNIADGFAVQIRSSTESRMFLRFIAEAAGDGEENVQDLYEIFVHVNSFTVGDVRCIFRWLDGVSITILVTCFSVGALIGLYQIRVVRQWFFNTFFGRNSLHSASHRGVAAIPLSIYTEDDETKEDPESCVICIDTFTAGDSVRTLPCDHIFHQACIDKWLLWRKKECPLCWQDVEK